MLQLSTYAIGNNSLRRDRLSTPPPQAILHRLHSVKRVKRNGEGAKRLRRPRSIAECVTAHRLPRVIAMSHECVALRRRLVRIDVPVATCRVNDRVRLETVEVVHVLRR